MADQISSPDGRPRKDANRPSPDVERFATDGQSNARGKGASDAQGQAPPSAGDGPARPGVSSGREPDLVAPGGVNERDHGAAEDKPMGGGSLQFDDDDAAHPRGNTDRTGGTWQAQGGDSGRVGKAPGAGRSDRTGPDDPDGGRGPGVR